MNVRRSIAVAAALLAVPALSSCGFDVQTNQAYNPTVGVYSKASAVEVLNALVVVDSNSAGKGTVIATLVNSDLAQADKLTGVSGSGESGPATFTIQGGSVEIPAGGLVDLSETGAVSVDGGKDLMPGLLIPVTFTFERAAQVTLKVPVVTNEGPYAEVPVP
ncbi:hypothetical protein [Nocardioides mesophilus]|uniref:Copper chaperone PCu(A)C n=1 Tax=Nocardioides mesophilus TaxID=433659 RepID=A0A7G9RE54_9ACTN|nr:hypothetical protein [Nocardioides mesophilus]QNN53879.1 hypothetical protein H9L09_05660 [Nocardioides mesophilus]